MPAKKRSAQLSAKAIAARDEARPRRQSRQRVQERVASSKPFVRSTAPRVTVGEVEFIPMKSLQGTARVAWHIVYRGTRAGVVSILFPAQTEGAGKPTIDVRLNANSRGRGIGTIAFRHASEFSGLSEIFASITKANIGSRIAAERAGYRPALEPRARELKLVWRRPSP